MEIGNEELFSPVPQPEPTSDKVKKFIQENPSANWRECLEFLIDGWPQLVGGSVQYLIEGGAAVKLLFPERQEPEDIDVLTRNEDLKSQFQGNKKFGIKRLADWYVIKVRPFSHRSFDPSKAQFVFDHHERAEFNGRNVLILNRLGLSTAKSMHVLRDKDVRDLILLNQDPAQVAAFAGRIRAAYVHDPRL